MNRVSSPWLLWDGECGLCSASVEFLMRKGAEKGYRISMWQNAPERVLSADVRGRVEREFVIAGDDGTVIAGGADAILRVLRGIGWWWVAPWQVVPLVWVSRGVYRLVARNRGWISKRFFGGRACGIAGRRADSE